MYSSIELCINTCVYVITSSITASPSDPSLSCSISVFTKPLAYIAEQLALYYMYVYT